MDTNLIKLVNKLQDAFATVGVHNPVDLPQIVVIGSQSSGKSSVLENIVGKAFLPRGTGIVTRRPLVLQLLNRPSSRPASQPNNSKSNGVGGDGGSKVLDESNSTPEEWGEFLHIPGRKFTDFNKIRDEIVRDTEEKTGKGVGISPQPINLRVYSPYVLTLTLVDLPGLTKVPVGDQPKDIERQIREMILKYISKTNSIILAVTGANTDLANSDGLKLARDVDPDGMRSIGVLTKIDLMDPGTDVVDILAGRVIPLRLGYVPVVNRGQKDVESSLAIRDTLEKEREFFENHPSYKSKAQYCGTPFLSRKLNMILMHHIRTTLPEIKTKIAAGLAKYQAELSQLGDEMLDGSGGRGNFILQITTDFCHEFRTVLEGTAMDLTSNELSGGARISFVFHELFANGIRAIDPLDQVKDSDIRTIMYNSSGSKPALFVGTQAFEVLVKQQIKRLEEPSLKCVTLVFDEMVRILGQLLQKHVFKRFPSLKERVYVVVVNYLKRAIVPTNKLCSDIISAESCYINTGHPDFISGHKASSMVLERMKNQEQKSQKVGIPIGSTAGVVSSPAYPGGVSSILEGDSNVGGFFGSFFQRQKPKKGSPQSSTQPVLEAPPLVLKAQGNLSEREHMETEVIKLLLNNYFNIVKRTVADLVPKAIMLHLVQNAKENLQRELLSELYKSDVSDVLLRESEFTVQRRNECRKMIDALKRADEIVSNV